MKKNTRLLTFALGMFSLGSLSALAAEVTLKKGQTKTMTFSQDIVRVNVAMAGLFDLNASQDKRTLRIRPLQFGSSEMNVRFRDGSAETHTLVAEREALPALARTGQGTRTETRSEKSLAVDVLFLEHTQGGSLQVGLKKGSGDNPLASISTKAASGALGGLNWSVAPLASALTLLQEKGISNILSNPRIVVNSGKLAKFHSGGQVFVSQSTGKDSAPVIVPVDYGMLLNVQPTLNSDGTILSSINTEVSEFVKDKSTDLPAKSISKTDTEVKILDGQSVMLSGFKLARARKKIDRVPLLADVPVLGEAFKNRETDEEKRDMVVLLTIKSIDGKGDSTAALDSLEGTRRLSKSAESVRDAKTGIDFDLFD
jgi:hypothetical protein